MVRRILLAAAVLAVCVGNAEGRRYFVGPGAGVATLAGGERPYFFPAATFGLEAGFEITPHWTFETGLSFYRLSNDSLIDNSFSFDGDKANATARFKATRLSALASVDLFSPARWFSIRSGLGGGLLIWKVTDPIEDTVYETSGSRGETIDFSSTEIFLGGRLGTEFRFSPRVALLVSAQADYLTGAGTDFAKAVADARDHWLVGATASLRFSFGSGGEWASGDSWATKQAEKPVPGRALDSDGDGVSDAEDRCPDTPEGVLIDQFGCALDSDGDGIMDGRDHCPGTDARARGLVDIYGCPVDSDFDGVADYLDQCPNNRQGAAVDASGCPADDDGDGVANGLDDCPSTLYGIPVDKYGCTDLAMFDEPMVLHIDYASGSFEIDGPARERLRALARVLMVVPEIRLEIYGYTDNIGAEDANLALSEKRANRVRDFLVAQGVEEGRIRPSGRGESNFVASNDTADGRAMNRRIEIVFHR